MKRCRVVVYVEPQVLAQLELQAKEQERTISGMAALVLKDALANDPPGPAQQVQDQG